MKIYAHRPMGPRALRNTLASDIEDELLRLQHQMDLAMADQNYDLAEQLSVQIVDQEIQLGALFRN